MVVDAGVIATAVVTADMAAAEVAAPHMAAATVAAVLGLAEAGGHEDCRHGENQGAAEPDRMLTHDASPS
jgi:hypothetical protein